MSEMQPPLPTSYFTCTLGEAALLNKQLPEKAPYSTVNEFIDYLAATHTDDVAVACASPPAKSKSENGDAPNGVPNGSKGTTGEKDDAWEVESLSKWIGFSASRSLFLIMPYLADLALFILYSALYCKSFARQV